jgi:hypothetical protein
VGACVNWTIIYPKRDEALIVNFEKTLASCASSLGLVFKASKRCPIEDTRFSHYIGKLDNAIANNMELIMIVIPNNKAGDLYSMVKKKCSVEAGVPNQVVPSNVLAKD